MYRLRPVFLLPIGAFWRCVVSPLETRNPGTRPSHIESFRVAVHEITETPAGKGAQNELNLGGSGVSGGEEIGEVNGTDELYVPKDNTVYLTSQYGHSITKGPRPGTFIYAEPKIAYHDYRALPATPANERLLDLTARHPQARVVHSDRAYRAAQGWPAFGGRRAAAD